MHLSLIREGGASLSPVNRLLVVKEGGAKLVRVAERAVSVPLISLLLGAAYCELGAMIETGDDYGLQVSAKVYILHRGVKRSLVGAIVPLVDGPDLVLPLGFLKGY
jgi:hypothetical protein